MSIDLRPPNITANTPEASVFQIKSYLIQLVGQLQYAFNEVQKEEETVLKSISAKGNGKGNETDSVKAQNTFNSIKALIIKSADIVNAYYEQINIKLSGEYVAKSEFGIFSESTSQEINENSTEIEQIFTNIQEIISSVDEIENTLLEVNAYIKSGLLGYDSSGLPIFGLEIGQRNEVDGEEVFNKYARFSANRLSFYDQNDTEVAYISDYKLYITEAQISGNLTIGEYVIDSSDGLLFRWEGD